MDSIPSLLGLALRAGRLAVGEEPVGVACRCHKGYLLLLASDAADNTIRRALHFCQAGKTICLTLTLTTQPKSAPPTKTRARAGPENESRTAHPTTAAKGMDKRRSHTL